MAKINEYQQGQLASPVVGTPGVDNSAAQTLGSIAGQANAAGNSIATYARSVLESQAEQQRQAMAAQRAAQKQLDDASREAYVQSKTALADSDFTDLLLQKKQQFFNDTTGMGPDFQKSAGQIAKSYVDAEPNPLVKANLQKAMASKLEAYNGHVGSFVESRQVPIIENNIMTAAGALSQSVNQASLTPDEVKQKLMQYAQNTAPLYQFTKGNAGPQELREKGWEPAIQGYLSSVSLNNPDGLEATIHSFADGQFIDPTHLDAYAGRQRAIAAQVKSAQHADQQLGFQATKLQVVQAIQDSAQKKGSGYALDADPKDIDKILKQYGPSLSPQDYEHYLGLPERATQHGIQQQELAVRKKISAQKTAEEQQALKEEAPVANNFGYFVGIQQKLSTRIDQHTAALTKAISAGDLKTTQAIMQTLSQDVNQYGQQYQTLHALESTLVSPQSKDLAKLSMSQIKANFDDVLGKLSKNPDAIQATNAQNSLLAKLNAAKLDQSYPGPRQQAVYRYLFQSIYYDTLRSRGMSLQQMNFVAGNQTQLNAMRNLINRRAQDYLRRLGVAP
jgi:hypothetical protein